MSDILWQIFHLVVRNFLIMAAFVGFYKLIKISYTLDEILAELKKRAGGEGAERYVQG